MDALVADAFGTDAPAVDALAAVRARIAEALLGRRQSVDSTLGVIALKPHQVDAVHRLRTALHAYGGALLADAPGLGKTFVALAVARDYCGAVVAGPAALRAQWKLAAERADVPIRWCSLETLSRRPAISDHALLIVDEAHHLRNPGTRRYAHTAALAVGKRVLLVTATPVHNRPAERDTLLALFLGTQAEALDAGALARLVVRREADPSLLPTRSATRWLNVPGSPDIDAALRALPPPLPAADGRLAAALVRMTFTHAWSSSIAALHAAARRATHRAQALDDALSAGRWPTRSELHAWVSSEESSQLAFAELVAAPSNGDPLAARALLARHVRALASLRTLTARHAAADTGARAETLRQLLRSHPGATIIAFSRYAGTIDALWGALRFEPGVVAITAGGVRSAGGGLRRRDVLAALAADGASSAMAPLRLVLSTDLLGEGLDLRAASVVVHLDQPWAPALLDQREGRAARLSSPHASIAVYAMRSPRRAERLLALGERLRTKRAAMEIGTAAGSAREALLTLVGPWVPAHPASSARCRVATARASSNGWVAAVRDAAGDIRVIASSGDCLGDDVVEDDTRLLALLRGITGAAATDPEQARDARRATRRWLVADTSAHLASASSGESGVRAAIARRLDEALRGAPLHQRTVLRARVAALRAQVTRLRGAGVERALAAAAGLRTIDEVLDALARLGAPPASARGRAGRSRLLALLMLVPEE